MESDPTIEWLLQGDVSIAWQTTRDLLGRARPALQKRIATEGWGKQLLDARNAKGSWGRGFYVPRWACTHYVLLELRNLGLPPDHPDIRPVVTRVLHTHIAADGGLGHAPKQRKSDTCINGMFLNYASYFAAPADGLTTVVDFLLSVRLPDGGFNCQINRRKVSHSSLHSTLSVLEGLQSYQSANYRYRLPEVKQAAKAARGFIRQHRFYKSDRTGHIINKDFLSLPYPARWRYNILRSLDHFRAANCPYDSTMDDALDALIAQRREDGRWARSKKLPGEEFFSYEAARAPSRWNTLLALRVLKAYPRASIAR